MTFISNNMNAQKLVEFFIHSCSHDLRSPLASIKGLVQIAEGCHNQEETRNCLGMITDCADRMNQLIKTFEEYMETNQHVVAYEEANCRQLTSNIISLFKKEIEENNLLVENEVEVGDKWSADIFTFKLLLKHLISNAITFYDVQKKHRSIKVSVRSKKGNTFLEVNDNGIGISERVQQKIFDPFYRASTQATGFGMGLFLVNNLVHKTGARLGLESIVHSGSRFLVVLPNK